MFPKEKKFTLWIPFDLVPVACKIVFACVVIWLVFYFSPEISDWIGDTWPRPYG